MPIRKPDESGAHADNALVLARAAVDLNGGEAGSKTKEQPRSAAGCTSVPGSSATIAKTRGGPLGWSIGGALIGRCTSLDREPRTSVVATR